MEKIPSRFGDVTPREKLMTDESSVIKDDDGGYDQNLNNIYRDLTLKTDARVILEQEEYEQKGNSPTIHKKLENKSASLNSKNLKASSKLPSNAQEIMKRKEQRS